MAEASELSTLATAAESLSAPGLKRSTSNGSAPSALPLPAPTPLTRQPSWQSRSDWHLFLTIEERQTVRNKIKEAYMQRCSNFEELLEACVAIEEELLYMFVPSRLDYFKSGMQYDKRVQEKRKQLSGQVQASSDDEKLSDKPTEEKKTSKRGRHT